MVTHVNIAKKLEHLFHLTVPLRVRWHRLMLPAEYLTAGPARLHRSRPSGVSILSRSTSNHAMATSACDLPVGLAPNAGAWNIPVSLHLAATSECSGIVIRQNPLLGGLCLSRGHTAGFLFLLRSSRSVTITSVTAVSGIIKYSITALKPCKVS